MRIRTRRPDGHDPCSLVHLLAHYLGFGRRIGVESNLFSTSALVLGSFIEIDESHLRAVRRDQDIALAKVVVLDACGMHS